MSDDIVQRLRDACPATQDFTHTTQGALMDEAADAIQALTAERDALGQDNHRWKMECENFWRDREKTLTAERDRLRAALWEILACETPNANATVTRMASITKAALKGESHE